MSQLAIGLERARPAAYHLRPYQLEAVAACEQLVRAGTRRLLVALPTGTGKTVVFARLPGRIAPGKRWLVLAHREELLDQAAAKLRASNPTLSVGVEQADRTARGADLVVASVQTLQRKRLARLDPSEFGGLIVDEAHHAVAPTYRTILEHFGAEKPGGLPLFGFTATPTRGDQVGLSQVFDRIAYEMGIEQAVKDGWLVPICGHRVSTGADLSCVKVRAGEFVTRDLADAVDTDERNALIVRAYREMASGRRALAFCVDVAHARRLSETFEAAGISAGTVSGETPKDERRAQLRRFSAGQLQVLTNCNVLTEGFDDPGVSAILMARPTKSSLLYTQMLGRGTRLCQGKRDLRVIDFADLSTRHTLASAATLFGLPPGLDLKGKSASATREQLELYERDYPWLDLSALKSVDELDMVTDRIEFFQGKRPEEIARASRLTWRRVGDAYRLSLPDHEVVIVEPTRLDSWRIVWRGADGTATTVHECAELEVAIRRADQEVGETRPQAVILADAKARWRDAPATPKQIELLKKLHIRHPPGLSKGAASNIISMRMDDRRRRR